MTAAFQVNAFQNNAFQTSGGGGAGATFLERYVESLPWLGHDDRKQYKAPVRRPPKPVREDEPEVELPPEQTSEQVPEDPVEWIAAHPLALHVDPPPPPAPISPEVMQQMEHMARAFAAEQAVRQVAEAAESADMQDIMDVMNILEMIPDA